MKLVEAENFLKLWHLFCNIARWEVVEVHLVSRFETSNVTQITEKTKCLENALNTFLRPLLCKKTFSTSQNWPLGVFSQCSKTAEVDLKVRFFLLWSILTIFWHFWALAKNIKNGQFWPVEHGFCTVEVIRVHLGHFVAPHVMQIRGVNCRKMP